MDADANFIEEEKSAQLETDRKSQKLSIKKYFRHE